MKIEIEHIRKDWQVRIIESVSRTDSFHHIDRITTSPLMSTLDDTVDWLAQWVKIMLS